MRKYRVDEPRRKLVLRYSLLTSDERGVLCNGCGAKGGWFNPPDFFFSASCDHHDFLYWLGGSQLHRRFADERFYAAMCADVRSELAWWRRWWGYTLAWTYFRAVRRFGKSAFTETNYLRGWEDLEFKMELEGHFTEEANTEGAD